MPHAHHFLERLDRVTREQTEFALGLYRDHEAVAYVLGHVNLPKEATRVALAVDAAPDGPVVLVTREGRFVTCLGAGMRHEHPRVPHGQLKALLAKVEDKRARRELVQRELRPDEEEGDLLHRVFTRGYRLTREDFLVVSAFEPLLGSGPFMAMIDVGNDALKGRSILSLHRSTMVVNGESRKMLEKLHRTEWATAHLALLSGAADRKQLDELMERGKHVRSSATYPCSAQAGMTFYLRSAWMVGRYGKALIPAYKAAFLGSTHWMAFLDAGLGLGAIALRHSGTAAEIRRFLEPYAPAVRVPNPTEAAAIRGNCAWVMLDVMEHADERAASALRVGRALVKDWSSPLPEGHPYRYPVADDVPEALARTALLAFDGNMFDSHVQAATLTALPVAARASAEEFYLPRELVRWWWGTWRPEETVDRLKRWADATPTKVPRQAESHPGRNEPCTCGSGKKWKKCHGAANGVA